MIFVLLGGLLVLICILDYIEYKEELKDMWEEDSENDSNNEK